MEPRTSFKSFSRIKGLTGIQFLKAAEYIESNQRGKYAIRSEEIRNIKLNSEDLLIRSESELYRVRHEQIAYIFKTSERTVLVTKDGIAFNIFIALWELFALLNNNQFEYISDELLLNIDAIGSAKLKEDNKVLFNLKPSPGKSFSYPCNMDQLNKEKELNVEA